MVLMDNQHDKIWKGGGVHSPPLQTAVDTGQFGKLQESERHGIPVSGTKIKLLPFKRFNDSKKPKKVNFENVNERS